MHSNDKNSNITAAFKGTRNPPAVCFTFKYIRDDCAANTAYTTATVQQDTLANQSDPANQLLYILTVCHHVSI